MDEIAAVLLANLEAAYRSRGWHGPTVRNALRGVTAKAALARPAKERHTIWELTAHIAYWKYAVRRRLRGAKRGSFALKGSNWFAQPSKTTEGEWKQLLAMLESEHEQLRDAIKSLDADELRQPKVQRLIYGAAAHDLYHCGQIQLLRKMQK